VDYVALEFIILELISVQQEYWFITSGMNILHFKITT